MNIKKYMVLYDELRKIVQEIMPYYDVDKVKFYSVYIWTKGEDGINVFDIKADKIVFYDETHQIIEDAKPVIEKIQAKLKEIKAFADEDSLINLSQVYD